MWNRNFSARPLILSIAALAALVLPDVLRLQAPFVSGARGADANEAARQAQGGGLVGRGAGGGPRSLAAAPPPALTKDLRDEPEEKKVVTLRAEDFNAPNAKRPAKHHPFTAEELVAADAAHNTKRITKRPDGRYWVKYWKKNPQTGKKEESYVELEKYVAQLNQYELALNKAGCSLRKGPLAPGSSSAAGGGLQKQGPKPTGGLTVSPLCKTPFKLRDLRAPEAAKELVIFHDPNLVYKRGRLADYMKVVRGAVVNPAAGPARMNPAFGVVTRRVPLAPGLPGRTRVLDATSGEGCDTQPGASGDGVGRNPFCPDPKGCPEHNYTGTTGGVGKACGEKTPGNTTKCLYDGKLAAQWPAFTQCINAGNSWFGASLCAEANFSGSRPAGAGTNLSLSNGGGLHLDARLLGADLEVINVTAAGGFDGGQLFQKGPDLTFFDGLTLPSADYGKTIELLGPQALIFIGPVPIKLSTGLNARFKVSAPVKAASPVPASCGAPGSGRFGIGFQVEAGASLWARAALDVYVASAGVEAQLILTEDRFRMSLDTEVSPSSNDVVVKAGYDFNALHMKGSVVAFVEVDLLVYSERFDIELFSMGGYKTSYPSQPSDKPFWSTTFGAAGGAKKPI
jgi:hypothetical protein